MWGRHGGGADRGDRDGFHFFASLVTSEKQRAGPNRIRGLSTSWKLAIQRHPNLLFGAFLVVTRDHERGRLSPFSHRCRPFFRCLLAFIAVLCRRLLASFSSTSHTTATTRAWPSLSPPFVSETSLSSSFSVATTSSTAAQPLFHTQRSLRPPHHHSKAQQAQHTGTIVNKTKRRRAQEEGKGEITSRHQQKIPPEQPGYCPLLSFFSSFISLLYLHLHLFLILLLVDEEEGKDLASVCLACLSLRNSFLIARY